MRQDPPYLMLASPSLLPPNNSCPENHGCVREAWLRSRSIATFEKHSYVREAWLRSRSMAVFGKHGCVREAWLRSRSMAAFEMNSCPLPHLHLPSKSSQGGAVAPTTFDDPRHMFPVFSQWNSAAVSGKRKIFRVLHHVNHSDKMHATRSRQVFGNGKEP
jgi:hypothetical protein